MYASIASGFYIGMQVHKDDVHHMYDFSSEGFHKDSFEMLNGSFR